MGLLGADEPRYAQVAREMLERHDWVTPTMFGKPWLEKPPLYYWGAMLSYRTAGGVHDWAARMPSVVLCTAMVFFIFVWVRRFGPGMQLDAALITAGSAMVIGFSRGASTDMPLTATFTMAMLSWYAWHTEQRRVWLLPFYFFLALASLSKGPAAAFLAAVIIGAFAALRRDGRLLLRTLWPTGILVYLAVTLPWFIAIQRANPEFFRVFILEHNLARFATDLYRHKQPFWYFLPVALVGLLPWTVFVIAAVVDAIRDWRFSVEQPAGEEDFRTFLVLWLLLPIVFFSFSQSKLPGYILPAIPAGTLLLANFVRRREEEGERPALWLVAVHTLLAACLPVIALVLPFRLLKLPLTTGASVVGVVLFLCGVAAIGLSLQKQGYRVLRFVTMVPLVIAFALLLKGTAPIVDVLQSARTVQAAIQQTAVSDIPAVAVYDVPRATEYGLEFYRNQPVMSYERNEIPPGDHLVVAAAGTRTELEYRLHGRKVTPVGRWSPQRLDFFLVTGTSTPAQP